MRPIGTELRRYGNAHKELESLLATRLVRTWVRYIEPEVEAGTSDSVGEWADRVQKR